MTTKKERAMNEAENGVREAAVAFGEAIRKAEEAGYRVHWPMAPNQLENISVSETARVEAVRLVPVMESAAKNLQATDVSVDSVPRVRVDPPNREQRRERVEEVPVKA